MKRKWFLVIIPFIIGICCFVGSGVIGSEIEADGTLLEPFFWLIPVGYIFFFISFIILLVMLIRIFLKRMNKIS